MEVKPAQAGARVSLSCVGGSKSHTGRVFIKLTDQGGSQAHSEGLSPQNRDFLNHMSLFRPLASVCDVLLLPTTVLGAGDPEVNV